MKPVHIFRKGATIKVGNNFVLKNYLSVISLCLVLICCLSCEKEKMPFEQIIYEFEYDSIKDVEGNTYKTVKIGDQWWMAENLKVGHYRNNVPLFYDQSLTDSEWASLKQGAFCNLYNSSLPYNGVLYNWYAVINTNGIAPEGWHIPTDADWKKLEQFVGMNDGVAEMIGWRGTDEGEKLKSPKGKTFAWRIDPNINNTNQSGFTAFPGGCRLFNGNYGDSGQNSTGFWWTSSEHDNDQAWYRYLDYRYKGIFRYYCPKECGYSVRCVKDN
jgi:uncharacterized protein (TIGR02145 family)